jgi:hypothetical protein
MNFLGYRPVHHTRPKVTPFRIEADRALFLVRDKLRKLKNQRKLTGGQVRANSYIRGLYRKVR